MSIQPLIEQVTHSVQPDGQDGGAPTTKGLPRRHEIESTRPNSFDAIYEAWFDEVSKWIRAMGGPDADRDDLVQEVFVVVHRRLKDFDGENLAGWLYRIARGKVRDFHRLRWAKRIVFFDREPTALSSWDNENPLTALMTREKQRLLMRLLDDLNDTERTALVLFELEGYSGQEIAELQSAPLNTIWTRIHKARQKLSQRLLRLETGGRKQVSR